MACVGLQGRADTILFWASQCFGKKKKREKKNVLIANYLQYLPEQYFPNWPSSLQYIHLIKFWATTKASINKDICLHCPLMAFKRSVMERVYRAVASTHSLRRRVQMGRAYTRLAQIPRSVRRLTLRKRRTKSFGALRALVAGGKYLLSLPVAPLLVLSLIFGVRFVGGNLIALAQFEKMIQDIDSKHLITVWMDSPRWAQLILNTHAHARAHTYAPIHFISYVKYRCRRSTRQSSI